MKKYIFSKRLKSKIKSKGGVTLSEMLVALAIVALLTAAVATGISASIPVYDNATSLSEASMLASTLSQALMDELRFARDIQTSGDTLISYTSSLYGANASFGTDEDGHVTVSGSPLIGSGAYSNLTADVQVRYLAPNFTVKLTVKKATEVKKLLTFSVRALSPKTASA